MGSMAKPQAFEDTEWRPWRGSVPGGSEGCGTADVAGVGGFMRFFPLAGSHARSHRPTACNNHGSWTGDVLDAVDCDVAFERRSRRSPVCNLDAGRRLTWLQRH